VYQGSTSGTLLSTTITCYNGNSVSTPANCASTTVATSILRTTVFRYLPNSSGIQAETDTTFDNFGLPHEVDEYDYGPPAVVGGLIRKTITAYSTLGNGIVDRPSSVTIEDSGNHVMAYTSYAYDETTPTPTTGTPQHVAVTGHRGLLTTVGAEANATATLYRKYAYYDTGTLSTSTDVSTSSTTNGAATTYNYASGTASCGNSFVTSISEPLSLSRSMIWDCNGGVMLSLTDENSKTSSTAYSGSNYTNYFWRPYSTTDQAGTITDHFYYLNTSTPPQPFQTESKNHTAFNSGNSIIDVLTTSDGFGRTIFSQTKQGPSAQNYDTVATCYDSSGRVSLTTMPYSAGAITFPTSCPTSNAGNSTTYDALNRTFKITNTGGGSTAFSYNENDVLQTISLPSKSKQSQYDALGRLRSVCEITSGTTNWPSASCSQNASGTGYLTTYAYDLLGNLTNVTQNAQASSNHQARIYAYDMLGRITGEQNPETKNVAITYAYDSLSGDSACGTITSAGNLLKRTNAAGTAACYSSYDALDRVGTIIYPSTSTPSQKFVYDTATVNGVSMNTAKTRLARAYTCIGTCSSVITDLGFSYSPTGQTTDVYESTPNSGGYYHLSKNYYPNGVAQAFSGMPGIPTITYGVDGKGRWNTVSASSGQNPVTQTSYNPAGQVTGVTFGSGDSDAYQYDPNTGKLSQYTFAVNGSSVIGKLTWNSNGTLGQFQVTQDPFNAANVQTCNYGYDDLTRLSSVSCNNGSTWGQNFTYDVFGNIQKTVPTGSTGTSFQPIYDTTSNRYSSLCGNLSYDSNGNPNNDCSHTYQWDATAHPAVVDGTIQNTFDALGNLVEVNEPGFLEQVLHDFDGRILGGAHGQTNGLEWTPLPGGGVASYAGGVLQNYNHADWLGTTRFSSSPSRTLTSDWAVAPYAEHYVANGPGPNAINLFTGTSQSIAVDLYDTQFREYDSTQGRWISPDPAGVAAANPSDPQTWNRYAYVGNRPLQNTDPLGLDDQNCSPQDLFCFCPVDYWCDPGGGGGGGGGGNPRGGGRTGGVWPNNQTLGLPGGLGDSPFNLGSLLGLSPGTQCGDFTGCDSLGTSDPFSTFGFQEGGGNLPCTIACNRQRLWIFLKLITATGVYLLDRCAQVIAECKKTCAELYADDRSSLPGSGPDMFGRVRQCIRNCAADKECFNF
jgi:RHS repeat-associated protein